MLHCISCFDCGVQLGAIGTAVQIKHGYGFSQSECCVTINTGSGACCEGAGS